MVERSDLVSYRFKTDRGKTYFFDVKGNESGRFLKITESRPRVGEQNSFIRNFMTIPEDYLEEFINNLHNIVEFFNETGD
ncbi:DUF3276 family protein [Elusimicrobiota bacterium]